MSSQQKRDLQKQARRIAAGFPGLIPLGDIYPFEHFLTHAREWHSAVTTGNELLHVYLGAREIIITYSEAKRCTILRTLTRGEDHGSQHGMTLYYAYLIFYKRKDGSQ